jgi:SAM-dependent methyltransferase
MRRAPIATLLLYSATLFLGAGLLFVVQPMVGKIVLPLLGGTPAVWSTCMVFFQAALLGGYAYAHASTAWLGVARQAMLHLAVLVLPLSVLPLGLDPIRLRGGVANPVLDVLIVLSVSVGLPFLVVSATAPLLQKWFTHTGHPAARDPYFLYAASNLGSMLALLGYPTLIEPRLHLKSAGWWSQTHLWTAGYLALTVLTVACALILWRSVSARNVHEPEARATAPEPRAAAAPEDTREDAPTLRRRLHWVALAFVPSSLLLGVTTYITTDIAAVPLLWVLPLALYLLTFILAFGRWPARLHRVVVAATLPVVLLVIFFMVSDFPQRIWVTALWHFLLLLVVALACHGELAHDRPSPTHLTGFYLLIAVGGVLGGLFNALVAPVLFTSLAEYPLAMVLACMLVIRRRPRPSAMGRALLVAVAVPLGVSALALILYSSSLTIRLDFAFMVRVLGLTSTRIAQWLTVLEPLLNKFLVYGPPLLACFLWRRRPVVLGLALAGVLVAAGFVDAHKGDQIRQARSFFGVLRVSRDSDEKGYTELRHGTTLHGRQSLDPTRRAEPLSYYHREGPIGQIFAELDRRDGGRRVAVIGLGTGTLAAYARPGDAMTFYEIDRLVRDIAFDRAYFTYLTDARDRGATLRVELGDARVRLEAVWRERPAEQYDVIIVDAFTSDAIPVHLLTREALRLYLEMLAPGGLLAIHISNRHLRLAPVVANLAEDAGLGGQLLMDEASAETEGGIESMWALLARTPEALGQLVADARWSAAKLEADPRIGVWTDDFNNVLSVFKW